MSRGSTARTPRLGTPGSPAFLDAALIVHIHTYILEATKRSVGTAVGVTSCPRLSTLLFVSPGHKGEDDRWERPTLMLHTTILSSYHSFGKRIRNLSLDRVSFSTSCDLFRFVLAFPQIKEIVCHDIIVDRPETKGTSTLELMRSKLCNRLGLETLNVRKYPRCAMHMPAFQMIKC